MFFKKNKLKTIKQQPYEWLTLEIKTYQHKEKKALEFINSLDNELKHLLQSVSILSKENIKLTFIDDRADDELSDYTGEIFGKSLPEKSGSATFYPTNAKDAKIIVNMYNTSPIVHEFGHLLDVYSDGNDYSTRWSERDDFKVYVDEFVTRLTDKNISQWYIDYCKDPTEVFARLFQEYYKDLNGENKLTELWSYQPGEEVAKELYQDYRHELQQYFNNKLPSIYESSHYYKNLLIEIENITNNLLTETNTTL